MGNQVGLGVVEKAPRAFVDVEEFDPDVAPPQVERMHDTDNRGRRTKRR
jgi:hypothetical protein